MGNPRGLRWAVPIHALLLHRDTSPSTMTCSSTGHLSIHHALLLHRTPLHPCSSPLWRHLSIHAWLLYQEPSPPMPCFPAGTRSSSMPCSSAGHVLVPYPTCATAAGWQAHPTLPLCSVPLTLLPPTSFSDPALPETGRESPSIQVLLCHHFPTFPCLLLRWNSWEERAGVRTAPCTVGSLWWAKSTVSICKRFNIAVYLGTSSMRLCF